MWARGAQENMEQQEEDLNESVNQMFNMRTSSGIQKKDAQEGACQ